MRSKSTASTGVSAVSNPEYLEYRVSAVQNPEILRVLEVYTPENSKYSVAPHEINFLERALVGPSGKVFCQKRDETKRCGDGRSITHTPSILRIFR